MAVEIRELRFADRAGQASALAASLAATLRRRLENAPAALVVPGGATPAAFLAAFATQELPWERLSITLSDERWVGVGDPASNEGALRRAFAGSPAADRIVGLHSSTPTPGAGLAAAEARLRALPRPFAAVVLGMGDDGHVASLFPGMPGLEAALDPRSSALVADAAAPAGPRLSLTLAALLDADRVALLIAGEAKWRTYRRALEAGPAAEMPVRGLLRHATSPLEVWWAP